MRDSLSFHGVVYFKGSLPAETHTETVSRPISSVLCLSTAFLVVQGIRGIDEGGHVLSSSTNFARSALDSQDYTNCMQPADHLLNCISELCSRRRVLTAQRDELLFTNPFFCPRSLMTCGQPFQQARQAGIWKNRPRIVLKDQFLKEHGLDFGGEGSSNRTCHGRLRDAGSGPSKEPKLANWSSGDRAWLNRRRFLPRSVTAESAPPKKRKIDGYVESALVEPGAADDLDGQSVMAARQNEGRSEERRQWSRPGGFSRRKTPDLLPNKDPAHSTEIRPQGEGKWVTTRMTTIGSDIEQAVLTFCRENGIDEDADSRFVPNAGERLSELYGRVFGKEWLEKITQIQAEGHRLRQTDILTALLGAAVHEWGLLAALPWDLGNRLKTSLGSDLKYVQAVLGNMGYDYDRWLNYLVGKQICSSEFQKDVVAPYAKQRVQETAAALLPHHYKLKAGQPAQPIGSRDWKFFLGRAFQTAIVVKQVLGSSNLGPFRIGFAKHGDAFDMLRHESLHEYPGNKKVLYGVVPSVVRKTDQGDFYFAKGVLTTDSVAPKGQAYLPLESYWSTSTLGNLLKSHGTHICLPWAVIVHLSIILLALLNAGSTSTDLTAQDLPRRQSVQMAHKSHSTHICLPWAVIDCPYVHYSARSSKSESIVGLSLAYASGCTQKECSTANEVCSEYSTSLEARDCRSGCSVW
ncbi:uncharacterized protein MYCFIDRAFT_171564 [Pseudocercospora fijiensis CIRAD86]|uniref:Uncharacterized protein n=1 Tax=Pseudocercospora fijiensis (strain CIRAD86) TaxID=383855 RepID=M3A3L5_PSEFD|nr:uncharacterized protein MYCFIDRAFT_171564 [Pseudocercospora fijiensis CIRAD86]EME85679.1 hypothetical protein MYCFIDRAFT_171564 [Pseudocercospora fijiensis CIRAD86]